MSASRPDLKIDSSDEQSFVSFFKKLQNNAEQGTIRIFERKDTNNYYAAHGNDALFIAENVYRTTSILKYIGSSDPKRGLPSCTMAPAVFTVFLKDALFKFGLKVEIYSNFSSPGSKSANWKIIKQASPGNLQDVEDILNTHLDSSPVIAAVKIISKQDVKSVGVAFGDASVRELGVAEFSDNEVFSNFESLMIQLGVKECIIPSLDEANKDYDVAKISAILDRCNIVITCRKPADFSSKNIEQDLTRLLSGNLSFSVLPQASLTLAMSSAAALIKYLNLMNDPTNFGQFGLYQHDLCNYMRLDSSALRALNLMPGPRDASKCMSLFGLLNCCKTLAGTRLLSQWLKQPLMSLEEINSRHDLVETFLNDSALRQSMQDEGLRSIPDLFRISKRFQQRKASLEDVVRTYQVIIRLPDLVSILQNVDSSIHTYPDKIQSMYTEPLKEAHVKLEKMQELVETTVDLDALDNHEFIIRPDFDESLKEIHNQLDDLRQRINEIHQATAEDLKIDVDRKLKLEQHQTFGWCMRVTRTDSGVLRGKTGTGAKARYHEISTQKAGIYFTTTELSDISRDVVELTAQYNKTQAGLVREIISIAATYCPVLEKLGVTLAHLDVIVSFAHVSAQAPSPYVRPKMHQRASLLEAVSTQESSSQLEVGRTILKDARHPCMEAQDDVVFIPNDVELVRGSSEFIIITGPNMGGKSTYIRQIGVIALMAQAGCFVPCSSAELMIFDSILARVGAGDSQLKGVSTFMAEMLETATILQSATKDSLIVIDELGRGTSTYDGFGLAWAISHHIASKKECMALFATHFHELTRLADDSVVGKKIQNLHVVAHVGDRMTDGQELTLLYKVEPGISSQSFGIHVAELVKFPEKVIHMAKRKAEELEDDDGINENGSKKVICSPEQIEHGSGILKKILTEWKVKLGGKIGNSEKEIKNATQELRNVWESHKKDIGDSVFFKEVYSL